MSRVLPRVKEQFGRVPFSRIGFHRSEDRRFTVPAKPSELQLMSDDEMFTLLRHVAFENKWGIDAKVQFEAMARNSV